MNKDRPASITGSASGSKANGATRWREAIRTPQIRAIETQLARQNSFRDTVVDWIGTLRKDLTSAEQQNERVSDGIKDTEKLLEAYYKGTSVIAGITERLTALSINTSFATPLPGMVMEQDQRISPVFSLDESIIREMPVFVTRGKCIRNPEFIVKLMAGLASKSGFKEPENVENELAVTDGTTGLRVIFRMHIMPISPVQDSRTGGPGS
jgi:hypothetical protein